MTVAYIGLGANLGDREKAIRGAIHKLANVDGVRVLHFAKPIETEPVGPPDQPMYLNSVVEVETDLPAGELADWCHRIEAMLGRDRSKQRDKYDARVIDLDLLLFGDAIIDEDGLRVPHPEMHRRRFVLEPLCAIAADARHPELNKTARELLDALE